MSSVNKNLSEFSSPLPDGSKFKVAIVWAEWNEEITSAVKEGAFELLVKAGVNSKNIIQRSVPGTFELPLMAQYYARHLEVDGVICIGCVIQGETKHFDFICQAAANGIMEVGLKFNKPVIFGVLTTNTMQQAQDRAGGKHGNKGEEAAFTLLKMLGS
jgi:6,7-dimethyl-8-ribityllumazine synthase